MDDCVDISSSSDELEQNDNFSHSLEQPTKPKSLEKEVDQEPATSKRPHIRGRPRNRNLLDEDSKFLANFDPGTSQREKRKLARSIRQSIHEVKWAPAQNEKETTRNIVRDLCDCLDQTCPGCHFPCEDCGSEKCGPSCRKNRKWCYEEIDCGSRQYGIRHPFLDEQPKKKPG